MFIQMRNKSHRRVNNGQWKILKTKKSLQGTIFLENMLCNVAWREHVERIIFCRGKQKALVGKSLVREKQMEVENVSEMWEMIMDKRYFRMRRRKKCQKDSGFS